VWRMQGSTRLADRDGAESRGRVFQTSALPHTPHTPHTHLPALTGKIGQLEARADYSEAKAAHQHDVAKLNEAIRSDQAALAQLAEDAR
jgi:hypothetical protein